MKARIEIFLLVVALFSITSGMGNDLSSGKAILLRHDRDFHTLGFNAEGHLLGYSSAAAAFLVDNLSAAPTASGCWPSPDDNDLISGALSPDGETAALVFEINRGPGRIQLRDSRSGERRGPEFDPASVAFVAFSPDGESLAGLGEHEVFVFDAHNGKITHRMQPKKRLQVSNIGVEFSPNGQFLRTRNSYASYLWDLSKSELIGDLATGFYLSLSPDWALAAREKGLVDLSNPRVPQPLTPQFPQEIRTNLNWVAFSHDSKLVAVHTMDQKVRLWETSTGNVLKPEFSAPGRIVSMAFSPDGRYLAIYSKDLAKRGSRFHAKISIWEAATGRSVAEVPEVFGILRDWHFDPQNRYLVASLSLDRWTTLVWKLPESKKI